MKKLFITTLFLLPSFLFANSELEKQIAEACNRHAISLTGQIQSDVITELSDAKAKQTFRIAEESCNAYFNKTFNNNETAIAVAEIEKIRQERDDDSILDTINSIFSNEPIDKKVEKRLKKNR